jgi:hypothetical protein
LKAFSRCLLDFANGRAARELLALRIEAGERLADLLLFLGDFIQCRHSPFPSEQTLTRLGLGASGAALRRQW